VGRTLSQLRAELGVTKRTVQRDISDLEQAGFPIFSEARNGTVFWRFVDGFHPDSPVALEMQELMALYYSRDLLKPLQGTAMYEAIESAFSKIGAAIPAQGLNFLRNLNDSITVSTFGWKVYSRSREVIASLSRAVHHHFAVEMQHATAGQKSAIERRVDPYKLWYANGGLYLVGWDHRSAEFRVFAIERIRAVRTTNHRFEPREDFDFEGLQKTAFNIIWGDPQRVSIRFSPDQAPYVAERTWHSSQTITTEPDGSIVLDLAVANLWEIKRWLIGWGAAAQVLAPPKLSEEIQNECRSLLKRSQQTFRGNEIG
jgi:predicted DNA-binding transcriptional regulator YafY